MMSEQAQSVSRLAWRFAEKGFWPLAGKVGTTIFSIVVLGLLGRLLSLEQFGHYNLAMTVFFLLMYDYGLTGLMLRELGREETGFEVSSLFTINILMKVIAFIVGIAIGFLVYRNLMVIMVPVSLGWLLYYLQEFRKTILFARLRTFQAAMGELLNKGLILIFTAGVMAVMGDNVTLAAVMVAFLSANIVSYGYIHWVTREFPLSFQPLHLLGPQWRDFKPIILLAGLGVILSRIDILLLNHFSGAEAAGIFSLSERVRMSFVFLPATLVALLTPRLASATGPDHHIRDIPAWRRYQSVLLFLTSVSWICLLAAGLGAPFIVRLLVGGARFQEFESSVLCLQILVVGGAGVFLSIACQSIITVFNEQGKTISLYALTLALKIFLSIFLIPRWGVFGAAFADAIAYIACGLLLLGLYRSLYRQQVSRSVFPGQNVTGKSMSFFSEHDEGREFRTALKRMYQKTMHHTDDLSRTSETRLPGRRRVLSIIDTLRPDGAQQLLMNLLDRLEENGWSSAVIAIVEGGPLVPELRERGIPLLVTGKPGILSLSPLISIMRAIRIFKPHIVHTHLFAADTYGRLAAFLSRPSPHVVTTEHNINLDEGPLKRSIKSRLSRINTCMVFLNQQVMRYSIDVEGCRPTEMAIISNGVDPGRFYCPDGDSKKPPAREWKLLSVGRLMPQKGHDVLIEAIRLIIGQGHHVSLTIAGDGPLLASHRQQIEELGLTKIIRLAGHVPQDHMPALYRQHDIFCFPSRFEGQGIALIEAMACGLPVVATATGGIIDLVTHRHDGLLIDTLDPPSLADAVAELIRLPDLARKLSKNALQTSHRYDLKVTLDQYSKLYQWIAGKTDRRPPSLIENRTF